MWDVLKHPVTGLLVGIGVTLLFHHLSQREAAPVFATSDAETIASAERPDPRLIITWDGIRIPGMSSTRVALWNAGKDYIDPANVLSPITIIPEKQVPILDVNVLRTSRPELRITPTVFRDPVMKRDVVRLSIEGDEVLERNDGVMLGILYASVAGDSLSGTDFRVAGRIKGIPAGFRRQGWAEANAGAPLLATIIVVLFWGGIVIVLMVELSREWRAHNYRQAIKGTVFVAVMGVILVLMVREATAPWPEWARTPAARTR